MGLDMYLSARRTFHATSAEADAIRAAAEVDNATLLELAGNARFNDEAYVYLPMWDHIQPAERTQSAKNAVEVAGLTSFVTSDAPSGELGYADGRLYVQVHCLYWRKANAIHSWFVENCQDGVDECQEVPVHAEQLAALRSTCLKAAEAYENGDLDIAEDTLTPQGGFFFGGTAVDEYWASQAERTAGEIERLINLAIEAGGVSFTYQSSW